jgi:hypothetical protein
MRTHERKVVLARAVYHATLDEDGDGEIKRTGVRRLPAVATGCLHIGFFNLRWPLDGVAQGGPPSLENFSCFISIFEALAPAMWVNEDFAVCSP